MKVHNYNGDYFNIVVEEPLGEEGILSGKYGNLRFKRCRDGITIIDSCFKGSGFVSCPTGADIGIPGFINGIPVTEIRQNISINSTHPIAVEAPELKRAYLRISKKTLVDQLNEGDALRSWILSMLADRENINQDGSFLNINIDFYKQSREIDYCEGYAAQCGKVFEYSNTHSKTAEIRRGKRTACMQSESVKNFL
jgi:hypothetical protein